MISLFEWFLATAFYMFGAGVTGGIIAYVNRANRDGDKIVLVSGGAIFWPAVAAIAAVCGVILAIVVGTNHVCTSIGRSFGTRAHKSKITRETVKMMEQDLERANGNMELVINFAYKPCPMCWGSGCSECHQQGVIREKAKR